MTGRMCRALVLLIAAAALVGGASGRADALVTGSAPSAVVSPNPAVQDAIVEVRGNGWRALSMVTAAVCGNEALDGSKDCDLEGATVTQVFEDGTFMLRLLVRLPPSPCPCLIRITDMGSTVSYDLPLRIANAPVATPKASSPAISGTPALTVVAAHVEDDASIASLFGAPAKRSLVLLVRNDTGGSVTSPLVTANWGRGGDPSNTISSPDVEPLAPGEVREITLPFELSALAFGEYTVSGAVTAFGLTSDFETSTSQWPWGLLIVAVVLVQLLVIWIVRRNRRLRLEREAELAAAGTTVDEAPAEPATDAPEEEDQLVLAGHGPTPIGHPAGDRTTEPDPTIPPRSIGLDGPVTAAPWH